MRIDAIVNTRARLNSRRPAIVEKLRRAAHGDVRVHLTTSMAELDDVARDIARRGTDVVALSGGDGSLMAGTTAIARAFGADNLPKIAVLPGGTVATVARNWGVFGDPVALFERLVATRDPKVVRRPSLSVVSKGEPARVGFIFGTGLVARFFDLYYAAGARGYGSAARIVARIFVESFYGGPTARHVLDPLPCAIDVDGNRLDPKAFSLVCASVIRDLGIGMRVTYRGGEDVARPHLVASSLPPRKLGPRAPLVLAGRSIGGANHFDDLVGRFAVTFPNDEQGPYVLDGDIFKARRVEVSAGPVLSILDLSR
jgi:diacylglycerol kinase family enzyme